MKYMNYKWLAAADATFKRWFKFLIGGGEGGDWANELVINERALLAAVVEGNKE